MESLKEGPIRTLVDAVRISEKLISPRSGIISRIEFEDITPNEPQVYFARSTPARAEPLNGMETVNFGDAASVDPSRAHLKAMGESIERYCSAFYDKNDLILSSYNDLDGEGIDPEKFALFSPDQYSEVEFPFTRMDRRTPMRWVSAFSMTRDCPLWAPASFFYLPYTFDTREEPVTHNPISTGLACGPDRISAISKGIFEVIERDAFMIVWKNRLSCPELDLATFDDPMTVSLMDALEGTRVSCRAYLLSMDIQVPVILVLLSNPELPPYTVMGISANLDPAWALNLALEEACLSLIGMGRYARSVSDFKPDPDFKNVTNLNLHGLSHATHRELMDSYSFLGNKNSKISAKSLVEKYQANSKEEGLKNMIQNLQARNLEVVALDMTTGDVDETGLKVTRVVIPGMQPLDVNHARRYLGGRRLYEVPVQLGRFPEEKREGELNPYPHMFP